MSTCQRVPKSDASGMHVQLEVGSADPRADAATHVRAIRPVHELDARLVMIPQVELDAVGVTPAVEARCRSGQPLKILVDRTSGHSERGWSKMLARPGPQNYLTEIINICDERSAWYASPRSVTRVTACDASGRCSAPRLRRALGRNPAKSADNAGFSISRSKSSKAPDVLCRCLCEGLLVRRRDKHALAARAVRR